MSYLIECLDNYMDGKGCTTSSKRRPLIIPDTSFVVKSCKYDNYEDLSWDLLGGHLGYTEGLKEEYKVHNDTYLNWKDKEIPDKVYNDLIQYGDPVENFFEEDVEEYDVLDKHFETIDKAVNEAFEEENEVSITDRGILAAGMELYPRRVILLSDDKDIREPTKELWKGGYNSCNSGFVNMCVVGNQEISDFLDEVRKGF